MPRKKAADSMEINDFLGEMISIIETRLQRQEESISKIEDDVRRLKAGLVDINREAGLKIDKSVLKVLRQH